MTIGVGETLLHEVRTIRCIVVFPMGIFPGVKGGNTL